MGLSASQARLLSITARISDNELHSQQIANSKVRLADKTQEASNEYIDALNTQKLVFTTFDAKGNSTQVALTAAYLYDYAPLKNQYVLQDSSGNYLLSAEDIRNYENTDNIMDFLSCYDLLSSEKYKSAIEKYNEDLKAYNDDLSRYNTEKAKYDAEKSQYDSDMLDYNAKLADYERKKAEYDEAYQKWLQENDKPQLYDEFVELVGTQENRNRQAGACYDNFLTGGSSPRCYSHLLEHLLDYKGGDTYSDETYYTSYTNPETNGKDSYKISDFDNNPAFASMHSSVSDNPTWLEFVDAVNDSSRKCDSDDFWHGVDDYVKENRLQDIIDKGEIPTKKDILISDYMYDPDTNKVVGVKTLKQKMIDILYMIYHAAEFDMDFEAWKETLVNFTEGDMRNLSSAPTPIDPFTEVPPLMPEAPVKPEPPAPPEYTVEINDQDKAQWYVNLWYMMNGSDTANLVKEDPSTDLKGVFVVAATDKVSKGNYKALDDNLLRSESWIQFVLEHGIATFVQAQFMNPSEDSHKAVEINSAAITWLPTVYTSCADISEVDDELAIAKAEAEYNKKLNEIEAKDKKYDNDIKKLDTEHNALQTEYESVKEVISKNIERSFKTFS